MDRILIVSDIHGELNRLKRLTGFSDSQDQEPFYDKEAFDGIFLLGDYVGDMPMYCLPKEGDAVIEFIIDHVLNDKRNIVLSGNHDLNPHETQYHPKYENFLRRLPESYDLQINKYRIHLRHSIGNSIPDDDVLLQAENIEADIIFFGHDHKSRILKDDGKLIINPGALVGNFGGAGTFVIMDMRKKNITINAIEMGIIKARKTIEF